MTPEKSIDSYLDHLRVERRLADHTLESYARDLRSLAEFAAGRGSNSLALDRRALEAFVRDQMSSGLSPRSVGRAVAAVRGYYKFLVVNRELDQNPILASFVRSLANLFRETDAAFSVPPPPVSP